MTAEDYHRRLPAGPEAVGTLIAELEAWAEAAELNPRLSHHLVLLAEEVVANVVLHAEGASFVALALQRRPDALLLVIEDDGPAFDPLAAAAPDTAAPIEERDPGGLGLLLVRRLSRQAEYRREGTVNRLSLTLDAA